MHDCETHPALQRRRTRLPSGICQP
jgi:hypothetical protein